MRYNFNDEVSCALDRAHEELESWRRDAAMARLAAVSVSAEADTLGGLLALVAHMSISSDQKERTRTLDRIMLSIGERQQRLHTAAAIITDAMSVEKE